MRYREEKTMDRIQQKEYSEQEELHWQIKCQQKEEMENLQNLLIKYPNSFLRNYWIKRLKTLNGASK